MHEIDLQQFENGHHFPLIHAHSVIEIISKSARSRDAPMTDTFRTNGQSHPLKDGASRQVEHLWVLLCFSFMSTSTTSRCISATVFLLSLCNVTADLADSDLSNDWHSFGLSTSFHCGNQSQCQPGKQPEHNQCQYIKSCCSDTLGDDGLVNYLDLQYCTFNTIQPLGIVVLALLVFYAFLILGDVADDYFAPTMAELAEFLKVPHELAGVTFVAVNSLLNFHCFQL